MKKYFLFALIITGLSSCGPTSDAEALCECFTEVHRGNTEPEVCLKMQQDYMDKYKDDKDDYAEFIGKYDKCRQFRS